jgi:solute carrier family 32 (vesicular inhibitory amino acid transporter)
MAAAEEEEEWEDGRSVMPEEEDGDIEDVPPPPLLGRNFGSEDEDEDEAGSLNSQSQWWPRSFRYVRAWCILYDLIPASKATGDLVPKRLTNDRVDMLHVVYVFSNTPREATDTYTIAAPPGLRHLVVGDCNGLGSDLKLPLLSDKLDGRQDSSNNLLPVADPFGSVLSDGRFSDRVQQAPTTPGCNLTQTVFNGTVLPLQYTVTEMTLS